MDNRDVDGNQVQECTDKYDLSDVMHTGHPPADAKIQWDQSSKRFNVLDLPGGRDEVERMPRWR